MNFIYLRIKQATWQTINSTKVKVTQSCPTLCDPMELYNPWDSPGQNTGVGSCSLLQGIFPTHGSNPGLPHCRWILYQLNHKESPRILAWVAYPCSSGSFQPRNQIRVSCIEGGFFTSWATREHALDTCKFWVWIDNLNCQHLQNLEITLFTAM